jgi:hypothetical protein
MPCYCCSKELSKGWPHSAFASLRCDAFAKGNDSAYSAGLASMCRYQPRDHLERNCTRRDLPSTASCGMGGEYGSDAGALNTRVHTITGEP